MAQYPLSNEHRRGRDHHKNLADAYDPLSQDVLSDLRDLRGLRILEIGAGAGTMTHWLASQATTTGAVTAVDSKPLFEPRSGLLAPINLITHTFDSPTLPSQLTALPWDLIFARLTLSVLPDPATLAHALARSLARGGSLVLQEFSGQPDLLFPPPDQPDAILFRRAQGARSDAFLGAGVDLHLSRNVAGRLHAAGFSVERQVHTDTWTGGSPQASLLLGVIDQLSDHGLSDDDLSRLEDLLSKPGSLLVQDLPMATTIVTSPFGGLASQGTDTSPHLDYIL